MKLHFKYFLKCYLSLLIVDAPRQLPLGTPPTLLWHIQRGTVLTGKRLHSLLTSMKGRMESFGGTLLLGLSNTCLFMFSVTSPNSIYS